MKKIYVSKYPNGEVSFSSALGNTISSSSEKPMVVEIEAEDSIVNDYFNNPNDYIVDIINKTITKKV